MNFTQALKTQREAAGLSLKAAATRLHLSQTAYQDRERGRVDPNVPERCGLLVGLGMDYEQAERAATQATISHPFAPEALAQFASRAADQFVTENRSVYVFSTRDIDRLKHRITKESVQTPVQILGQVEQLSRKGWITGEHIGAFVIRAARNLGLHLPDAD